MCGFLYASSSAHVCRIGFVIALCYYCILGRFCNNYTWGLSLLVWYCTCASKYIMKVYIHVYMNIQEVGLYTFVPY